MCDDGTTVQVPAQPESLQQLRALVRDSARASGFGPVGVENLVLAVNEACMNVIQHGYDGRDGNIELSVAPIEGGVEFRVRDSARSVTLADWRPRALDSLRPGGLGVHFIREIMDEIAYLPVSEPVGNLLIMKKYLPQKGQQP